MNRGNLINRVLTFVLCLPMSLANAEQYVCVLETYSSAASGDSLNLEEGNWFIVDNLTGDIYGKGLLEYKALQIPSISRNLGNGSFRISYYTEGIGRLNFLIVFPATEYKQTFSFHIGESRFLGNCAGTKRNQIEEDAASDTFY